MPSCSQFILKHEEPFYGLCSMILRFLWTRPPQKVAWRRDGSLQSGGLALVLSLMISCSSLQKTSGPHAELGLRQPLCLGWTPATKDDSDRGTPLDCLLPFCCCPEHFLLGTGTLFQSPQLLMNEQSRSMTFDDFWNLLVLWLDGQALRFQTWALILILPFITFNLGQMTYFLLASVSSFIIGHSQSFIGQILVRTKWLMMQNVCLTPCSWNLSY